MLASIIAIRPCSVLRLQSSKVRHQAFPKADKQRKNGSQTTEDTHDACEAISVPIRRKTDGDTDDGEVEKDARRRFDPAEACAETLVALSALHFHQQALR